MATSLAGAVSLFIYLPALIAFGWYYIQIFSRQTAKRRNGRQEEVCLLRALLTNGPEVSSIWEYSAMGS